MSGILLKDYINMKKQLVLYLIIILLWAAVSVFKKDIVFLATIMVMFVLMVPLSLMGYDEKYKWDRMVKSMPVSAGKITGARYIFVLMFMAAVEVIVFAGSMIITGDVTYCLKIFGYTMAAFIIAVDVVIPVLYYFGAEIGRLALIIFIILMGVCAFGAAYNGMLDGLALMLSEDTAAGMTTIWAAAVVVSVVSFIISKRIYSRKEF